MDTFYVLSVHLFSSTGLLHDEFLHEVARQVGMKWEQLAAMLKVKSVQCEKIRMDHQGNSHQQIFTMLCHWRSGLDVEAEPKMAATQLINGLKAVGHNDVAEYVNKIFETFILHDLFNYSACIYSYIQVEFTEMYTFCCKLRD